MSRLKGYVDQEYLELVASVVRRHKERTCALMHFEPGHKVLDVGCGPGTDTVHLAEVVGLDHDPEMIAEADRRCEELGIGARAEHRHGDAMSLPFDTNYFDSSRSERLFQHLPNPVLALAETVRVTKSDGWILALDTDWSSLSIDTQENDIERKLKQFKIDQMLHNGLAGRQLYRLFRQANWSKSR